MMKRLINSRITWVLVPAGIVALIWFVLKTASNPVSESAIKQTLTQLAKNAEADPDIPWKHLAKTESFLSPTDEYKLTQKLPHNLRGLSMIGSPSKFIELATFAQTEPQTYEEMVDAIQQELDRYKAADPKVVFAPDESYLSVQYIAAAGAVGVARSGNVEQALDRLDLATELYQREMSAYLGSSPWHLRWQFDAIEKVAETTTSPEVLARMSKIAESYQPRLKPEQTSLNPWIAKLLNNPRENLPSETIDGIVRQSIYAAAAGDSIMPRESLQKLLQQLPKQGYGVIPWTTSLLANEIMLKNAAETEAIWSREIPESYLSGIRGREKLMAVSLLTIPQAMKEAYYTVRRSVATELLLTRAKILTSLYFSKNGRHPNTLSDLESLGLRLPSSTNWQNVLASLKSNSGLPDDGLPYGPIELNVQPLQEVALAEWLNFPDFLKVETYNISPQPEPKGSNTSITETAVVSAELSAGDARFQIEWSVLVAELRELAFRPGLDLTSLTITGSKGSVSLTGIELLDLGTTAPEGVGLSFTEEMAMRAGKNFVMVPVDPSKRTQLIPGKYHIAAEFTAPATVLKFQLNDDLLKKIKMPSDFAPQAVYWGPPITTFKYTK